MKHIQKQMSSVARISEEGEGIHTTEGPKNRQEEGRSKETAGSSKDAEVSGKEDIDMEISGGEEVQKAIGSAPEMREGIPGIGDSP